MEVAPVKNENPTPNVNSNAPLPQRNQKQGAQIGNDSVDKKPRFSDINANQGGPGGFQRRNNNSNNRMNNNRNNRNQQNQNMKPEQGNQPGGQEGHGNNQNQPNKGQFHRGGFKGGPGGGNREGNMGGGRNDDFFISRRLSEMQGPTFDLPELKNDEIKFSGRNRLYIGNLTNDVNENDLVELFKPFGEISETFLNADKNFAFLKLDYHSNAEKAKRELDGTQRKGRSLRVRFAPNGTILRVKNLTPFVSNELLYKSFEVFGPLERATVIADDRGKHTGEGIIEFVKKSSAMACIRMCSDKCFFLTAALRPVIVEPLDMNDEIDGLPDKMLNKKSQDFHHERSTGPRFAEQGSFEHEFGTRWKQLHDLFKTKHDGLKHELALEEEKLAAQMDFARYEHDTERLRQELRKREQDNERKKQEWEMREKQAEEQRVRVGEQMRRTANEMQMNMNRQDDEMRRRQQENTLFMQAQQLNSFLDQHDIGGNNQGNSNPNFDFRGGNNMNMGNNQQDQMNNQFNNQGNNMGGLPARNNMGGGGNNRPWERRGGDDFQNKRRRF